MWILVLIGVFIAIQLDYFFIGSIAPQYHLYTGFLFFALLVVKKQNQAALGAAILYGLILDLLIFEIPFGVLILVHIIIFMLLQTQARIARSIGRNLYIVLAFFSVLLYSIILEFAIFYSSVLFGLLRPSFNLYIAIETHVISSLLTTLIIAGIVIISVILKLNLRKWFFIR